MTTPIRTRPINLPAEDAPTSETPNPPDLAGLLEQYRRSLIECEARLAEADARAADKFAMRGERIRASALPLRLTVAEFARLARLGEETIRRRIRSRQIEAYGQPYLIPRRELEKLGVSLADATEAFKDVA